MSAEAANFSFWITVAFTLNYILGSGFLTLPWAFQQTGLALGVIILIAFGFLSILSVFFILEAIARGQKLIRSGAVTSIELSLVANKRGYIAIPSPSVEASASIGGAEEISPMSREKAEAGIEIDPNTQSISTSSSSGETEDRKMELTELCRIFLGPIGQGLYTTIIALYMYGTLWAYATVFAHAFAAHLSVGSNSYVFYVIVFACLVIPISLMEFREQVSMQVTLSIFRVIMVATMIMTTIVAASYGNDEFSLKTSTSGPSSSLSSTATKFELNNIYHLMPVAAYAYIFHHSVPSLAHSTHNKATLTHLFRTALVISMVAYLMVGGIVSLYFGNYPINTSSNLNWEKYVGERGANGEVPIYASLISFFVVLFPAIDVLSAYPLNAYTLGNNLMSTWYGKEMFRHQQSRFKLSLFRAIAAVPPIFGSLLITDLGTITNYTGLAAFGIAFIFPPLLARYSAQKLDAIGLPVATEHSGFWTGEWFQFLLCGTGVATLVTVAIGLGYPQ